VFRDNGEAVPGKDMTTNDFKKIAKFFTSIDFEGQLSDPVHHPRFIEFLRHCFEQNIHTEIHNASSVKSETWYQTAFKANPDAEWVFSIDGLPEESHKYRINQNGRKLYDIMVMGKEYLRTAPTWQYIVFRYNEESIDKAIEMAKSDGLKFYLLQSSRWESDDDPYRPLSDKYRTPLREKK